MDLLSQVLNSFTTQISSGEVTLNFDLFETNLVNLVILDSGLFYLLSGALSSSLSKREQKIKESITLSSSQVEYAQARLNDAQTKLDQVNILSEKIQTEAVQTAAQLKRSILDAGDTEVARLVENGENRIAVLESSMRLYLLERLTSVAVENLTIELESGFTDDQGSALIDVSISKLQKNF